MNIIAVDDERLALQVLEHEIKLADPRFSVQAFTEPYKAVEHVQNNPTDIAFLDIEMRGINGISLAKQLKGINPLINIIFVTGHTEYARDAIKLRASGYLMKPVSSEDIVDEIANLRNPVPTGNRKRIRIQTFGSFEVFVDDKPLFFSRAKSKELLAFLVDRKGASSTIGQIATVLWENKDYNRSLKNQIQNIVLYMMKSLRVADAQDIVIKSWNSLSVDASLFDCDYYKFLEGDVFAINAFHGEYMTNYSWAEFTTGFLSERAQFK